MSVVEVEAPKKAPFMTITRAISQMRKGNMDALTKVREQYGDFVRGRLGPFPVILLNHPDLMHEMTVKKHKDFHKDKGSDFLRRVLGNGLLTSEEDFHLRQRRMIQPAFHKERVNAYGDVMAKYADDMARTWQDGETRDVYHDMMKVTLQIIGKTMFDADVEEDTETVAEALETIFKYDELYLSNTLAWIYETLGVEGTKHFRKAIEDLNKTMYRIIDEHQASGVDSGDLLSMLLLAQDEDDGKGMSREQIRDESLTLFLAGHETTAIALTWTWYALSDQPEVEAKLHEELDRVLDGRLPTAADYPKLEYTRMVFSESMRLYPPAYGFGRTCIKDTELGGHRVAKGTTVFASPYVTQRDPRFFPDPERFDPERWRPEAVAARHKYAYFPFGGGVRKCIGEPFAWMEGVLLLAAFAQHWSLRHDPTHEVGFEPEVTLRPRGGMRMTLHKRK